MAVSGCVTPGIRPELHFAVQIDTTLHRSESRVIHGFQRFALSFNRTVVMLYTIAVVLVILWLLGLVTSYTMGGLIHVLLVIAIVVVLLRVISGRSPL
jgi:hypothetical protein